MVHGRRAVQAVMVQVSWSLLAISIALM